jgi:hypothetical protein
MPNSLNEGQINYVLGDLFLVEHSMAVLIIKRGQFDEAEGHCQRCLAYSKKIRAC